MALFAIKDFEMSLTIFLAKMCHYAQDHLFPFSESSETDRETMFQCTSYQVACFLAQNTRNGTDGVDWDIVLGALTEAEQTEDWWTLTIERLANSLGGWK